AEIRGSSLCGTFAQESRDRYSREQEEVPIGEPQDGEARSLCLLLHLPPRVSSGGAGGPVVGAIEEAVGSEIDYS
ncbi:hypothetical protein HKBW3S25_00543, partial [Candidatus Hakubella thermalkaliphila]